MAAPPVDKKGFLEKRQRGLKHPNTDRLRFQQRYFKLDNEYLRYYKDIPRPSTEPKGKIPIDKIKIIEVVDKSVFRKDYCFQVGDKQEVMYLVCSSLDDRTDWMKALEQACKNKEMLPTYHDGVYSRQKMQWSCCRESKFADGCTPKSEPLTATTVVRRTKVKDERDSKRKKKDFKSDFDSGYGSRNNSMDGEGTGNSDQSQGTWKTMECLRNFVPPVPQAIVAMTFMTKDILAVALDNYSVQMYDIPSNAIIHKICLTHPISSIDVWSGYLLIGSSLVHVVETRQSGKWRRTVVVDLEEQEYIQNPSQHLAVFNKTTGQFVTASKARNRLLFWPQPSDENDGLITDPLETLECSGNVLMVKSAKDALFVVHCQQSELCALDVFQWSSKNRTCLKTIHFEGTVGVSVSEDGEYLYLVADGKGVQELSVNTRDATSILNSDTDEITCLAESCLPEADHYFLMIGFASGKVEIRDTHSQQQPVVHCLLPQESSGAVASVAYREEENLIAVATESGRMTVWGGSEKRMGKGKTPLELLEISKFSIYMPASFSRYSILSGAFSFVADSRGGLFVNRPSYSLKIPGGAIRVGKSVSIQTGIITCVGSDRFKVPDNYHVVSPVVWFCGDGEEEFQKPLTIELQHCAQYGRRLTVLKAKCSDSSDVFVFEPQGEGAQQVNYATFQTKHFCVFCLVADIEITSETRVCVVPVHGPYIEQRKEVIFCVCYYLGTCIKSIHRQYKKKGYHCTDPIDLSSLRAGEDSIAVCTSRGVALTGSNEVQ
ncbi:Ras GTPase-activating protein 3 [Geodia barretti]|uniref:Ras GTPase-activating protein 3 n=1 Tax=Geodia barretti TaxID=519541 RepID=A0AA35RCQ8_GEOBA|nr:Ras GTPase-activating protein 3 [Geodia barretti]